MFFVQFETLDLEIFVICWIESVDPVDDLFVTNQIYSILFNAFEFKEITEVQKAHHKMLLRDDETRPRGCQYPTPPCALAKILPETNVRAYFDQVEIFFSSVKHVCTVREQLYECIHMIEVIMI